MTVRFTQKALRCRDVSEATSASHARPPLFQLEKRTSRNSFKDLTPQQTYEMSRRKTAHLLHILANLPGRSNSRRVRRPLFFGGSFVFSEICVLKKVQEVHILSCCTWNLLTHMRQMASILWILQGETQVPISTLRFYQVEKVMLLSTTCKWIKQRGFLRISQQRSALLVDEIFVFDFKISSTLDLLEGPRKNHQVAFNFGGEAVTWPKLKFFQREHQEGPLPERCGFEMWPSVWWSSGRSVQSAAL